jgi:hypothetical protein
MGKIEFYIRLEEKKIQFKLLILNFCFFSFYFFSILKKIE